MIWPLTMIPRWNGHPRPSSTRFDGLTVLVTAATTGLGLEAAKKVAAAGTATLIITSRDEAKGQAAKADIEAHLAANSLPPCVIILLTLEMTSPESIHNFVSSLKKHTSHLDHVVLNAGVFTAIYQRVPTSYELSIQINALSTTLLSLLLLPLLNASPLATESLVSKRPHLTYVSSYAAFMVTSAAPFLAETEHPLQALSENENFPTGVTAGLTQYGYSKLMLEYAWQKIAFLPYISTSTPLTAHEQPRVLIASVDPGPTATDIFRETSAGFFGGLFMGLMKLALKTPEQGANAYVSSLSLDVEGRGQMWMDDEFLEREKRKNLESDEGKVLGEKVWAEMRVWLEKEGGQVVQDVLGAKHE